MTTRYRELINKIGTPEGIRTPDLLLRRQLLYPTELLAHRKSGAGDGNRTRIPSLEGWCPSHCATPACALRGNRQLGNNSIRLWSMSRRKLFSIKVFSSFALHRAQKCGMIGKLTSSYTQRYRSGHNGADSKSVWSNPRGFESHPLRQKRSHPLGWFLFYRRDSKFMPAG